jgi:hypothetical protein
MQPNVYKHVFNCFFILANPLSKILFNTYRRITLREFTCGHETSDVKNTVSCYVTYNILFDSEAERKVNYITKRFENPYGFSSLLSRIALEPATQTHYTLIQHREY